MNVVAFILIFLFVPETAGATLGKGHRGLNYISLEELNYIFGVPTFKHASYQIKHMVPWGASMVKWSFECFVLRKDVEPPQGSKQVYTWVNLQSLREEEEAQERAMGKARSEDDEIEMTDLRHRSRINGS